MNDVWHGSIVRTVRPTLRSSGKAKQPRGKSVILHVLRSPVLHQRFVQRHKRQQTKKQTPFKAGAFLSKSSGASEAGAALGPPRAAGAAVPGELRPVCAGRPGPPCWGPGSCLRGSGAAGGRVGWPGFPTRREGRREAGKEGGREGGG